MLSLEPEAITSPASLDHRKCSINTSWVAFLLSDAPVFFLRPYNPLEWIPITWGVRGGKPAPAVPGSQQGAGKT